VEAVQQLIDLEERAARLYTRFFRQFAELPGLARLWWGLATEEHEHAGILRMVQELAEGVRVPDLNPSLARVRAAIGAAERLGTGTPSLAQALAAAVRLERSELDQLGHATVRAIRVERPLIPRGTFALHAAHLERLLRAVRKFGGEAVMREAWALSEQVRRSAPPTASAGRAEQDEGRPSRVGRRPARVAPTRASEVPAPRSKDREP
jgi:hypothetical protein